MNFLYLMHRFQILWWRYISFLELLCYWNLPNNWPYAFRFFYQWRFFILIILSATYRDHPFIGLIKQKRAIFLIFFLLNYSKRRLIELRCHRFLNFDLSRISIANILICISLTSFCQNFISSCSLKLMNILALLIAGLWFRAQAYLAVV